MLKSNLENLKINKKPRIFFKANRWYCVILNTSIIGYGDSIFDAYNAWKYIYNYNPKNNCTF